mmetsp:Transcript_15691/g.49573  ORF Transcript_15691/g.49573 Transcript_15691/m.49573 type:complete len:460 (-) Transcript_15691:64-1443(-)
MFEADIARTALRLGYEASRDGEGPLTDFRRAREAWDRRELDQDVYVEAALGAVVEAGLGLGVGGARSEGALQSTRWKRAVDRCDVPSIESFGVEVGAGLRRMGVHLLCDLESVDLVEIERVNPQEYLGGGEIDMEELEESSQAVGSEGGICHANTRDTRARDREPALIDTVDMLNRILGGGGSYLNEGDLREVRRVIRDVSETKGWDHLVARARQGVASTRHASEAALLGGGAGDRIVRVYAWRNLGEEGDRWLAQTECEYCLWSHGEWRSWGEIEILVRKSTIGEARIGHVQSACEWARKHRPIPIDFGTVLQGHMSIDDIKRVVGRCDKEELSETVTESEQIDHAKLKATRIMVDVYAPQKQFPFTTKWNNKGEPCGKHRLHEASKEQTYFRGSKIEGVGKDVRFLHLTTVDLGEDGWLETRVDAKSGISQAWPVVASNCRYALLPSLWAPQCRPCV